MPARRPLLTVVLAVGLASLGIAFAQTPATPRPAGPAASAAPMSRAPERDRVLPAPRAACVKENDSCAATNAKCCPGLVCIGVRNSFCAPSP